MANHTSDVYALPQAPASDACVKLVRSEPFQPDESPMPIYSDEAKAARVEGDVSFHLEVGSGCAVEEVTIDDGPEMLRGSVDKAVRDWKFCGVPEGQEIRATIAFRLNCPAK
jgi:outer membrane biosynthesis protein TonB